MSLKLRKVSEDLEVHPALIEATNNIVSGVEIKRDGESRQMTPQDLWDAMEHLGMKFCGLNAALLKSRAERQEPIDKYLSGADAEKLKPTALHTELKRLGYVEEDVDPVQIVGTKEPDIALVPGPQCVLPMTNRRFATRGAARWQSLLDSVYGSNLIHESNGCEMALPEGGYNPQRGDKVFEFVLPQMDQIFPLTIGNWEDIAQFGKVTNPFSCSITGSDKTAELKNPGQFVGHTENGIILEKNGLHVIFVVDKAGSIGATAPGNIQDILIESAITTIMDAEDSTSSVQGDEKATVYRVWNELMRGSLKAHFEKDGEKQTRGMPEDIVYTDADGEVATLKARSTALCRHVGIHLYSNLVKYRGQYFPEGLLDLVMTVPAFMANHQKLGPWMNTEAGEMFIVKPKLHGSAECRFVSKTFAAAEQFFGLKEKCLKIGLMDEEKRTSVNLAACVRALHDRVIFINTGFLDRTGDDISMSFEAGPSVPADEHKDTNWLDFYEKWNVEIAIRFGFHGKGMYAFNTDAKGMYDTKIAHPKAGANCAWVPSPSLAAIHAVHYMLVDVMDIQKNLVEFYRNKKTSEILPLLDIPLLEEELDESAVQQELDQNLQGLLGYQGPWVTRGVGCSSVPDYHFRRRMEDLATARIKAVHIANWLHHGIITKEQLAERMTAMMDKVDQQNAGDESYVSLSSELGQIAVASVFAQIERAFARTEAGTYMESVLRDHRQQCLDLAKAA